MTAPQDSDERNPLDDYYLELGPMEMSTERPMSFDDDTVTIKVRQRSRLVQRPVGEAKIVD